MSRNLEKGMSSLNKILLKDLNPYITCSLCRGYFIDATFLIDCRHTFCRACILRYFENSKLACPTCNVVYKKKSNPCFRSDPIIQALVYKIVPGLYSKEVQRREDFYRSTGVRASSSCSEDSVLGYLNEEHDEWMLSTCGDQNHYLSPDDAISLSFEYYQSHLDVTSQLNANNSTKYIERNNTLLETKRVFLKNNSANLSAEKTHICDKTNNNNNNNNSKTSAACESNDQNRSIEVGDEEKIAKNENEDVKKEGDRRYLQCPAAVTMFLLQKFLRMKYALSTEHRVDIIYAGEVLPIHYNLMDVAYTFHWERTKPMRFFYRIFTPAKIQPIKIISTCSISGKQLQVVPVKPPTPAAAELHAIDSKQDEVLKIELEAQNNRNKERLMANLQLQSKVKPATIPNVEKEHKRIKSRLEEENPCVYEYEEPDKDEIRAFAEKRDREWALQKQLDEEKEKHRNSKKRKKSKHSKGNLLYKRRKLHAEITSSEEKEESLKLKVKITPHNGYKHKHHKSSQSYSMEPPSQQSQSLLTEMSSKEKLLQMRQVRHKPILTEEKNKSIYQNNNTSTSSISEEVVKTKEEPTKPLDILKSPEVPASKSEKSIESTSTTPLKIVTEPLKKPKQDTPVETKPVQNSKLEDTQKPVQNSKIEDTQKPVIANKDAMATPGKTLRSDFSNKTNATKELCMQKYPTVQLERNEQTERHAQKTFLKTFQSYTEKLSMNLDKNNQIPKIRPLPQNTYPGKTQSLQMTKSLEQKIANLHQQQCNSLDNNKSSGVRLEQKIEKKPELAKGKPQILNSHYSSSGFTVCKVEAGAKRKLQVDQDKRPSLEITLINPLPEKLNNNSATMEKPPAKRPPPPTIPLERIKKSVNRVAGLSIIPKVSDKCDNTGALDLSKPSKSAENTKHQTEFIHNKILNGVGLLGARPQTPDNKNNQLSNLQMLSKVALEHPNINKNNLAMINANKRPQMPSLQTLKIPVPPNVNAKSNLAKLPKLTEISKTQFRMPHSQMRNMRPNQNQSVRNIPNPSLLVRQQNQNRLNSLNSSPGNVDNKDQKTEPNETKIETKAQVVTEERAQNKNNLETKITL